jgi:four helix bundle protein
LSRAADSIATNIAEGSAAASQRDFARFLDAAIKSSSETDYHLLKAHDRRLIPTVLYQKEADEIAQIRRMLHSLRRKVLSDLDKDEPD